MSTLPLVAVAGPTGSGKSALAVELARRFRGEIVNFDSVQVYRGFDVGTAKLLPARRGGIPHHLLDFREPSELFTAGDFVREAKRVLAEIKGRGSLPILCGGTGFYLRALTDGLSASPGRNEALREDLLARESRRPGIIHKLLARLDPASAARIHPNDLNKSIRALELRAATKRSADRLFFEYRAEPLAGYSVLLLVLEPPRDLLYEVLDRRCRQIWRDGLVNEVRTLLAQGVPADAKPFESLGYKQALQVVTHGRAESDALAEMETRTRQYAKRQMTWFRAEREGPGKNIIRLSGFGVDSALQEQAGDQVASFTKKPG